MKAKAQDRTQLIEQYHLIRRQTESLCRPLLIEDFVIQSMDDVSPPKWHLAHTTWFFETFLLVPNLNAYPIFHPLFPLLFNSYYQTIGLPYPRMRRGYLSRPTVETILAYRQYVDEWMIKLLHEAPDDLFSQLAELVILGLNHEQQHQELLITDIKYNFSHDPSFPAYQNIHQSVVTIAPTHLKFIPVAQSLATIGYQGDAFCFDNELPAHQVFLQPYLIASRLVTVGEYLEFIHDGGYQEPRWWLSDGWDLIQKNNWQAPLYWQQFDGEWHVYTLHGLNKLDLAEPVAHVSFYEADAYARFRNARLPSEAEWEHYVTTTKMNHVDSNFLESERYHPMMPVHHQQQQFFGDVWEWTSSAYTPYPGFKPERGALGEYNGKFMCNQMVLRGGSCATPKNHIRASYRNFFQPDKRWQFTGIRLAKDSKE